MNFCGECGTRLESGVKYCTGCGTPVGTGRAQGPANVPAGAPVPPAMAKAPPQSADAGITSIAGNPASRTILIVAGVLLAALAVFLLSRMSGDGSETAPSPAQAASTSGPAVATSAALPAASPTPVIDPANLVTTDGMMGIAAGQAWSDVAARFKPEGTEATDDPALCNIFESRNGRISAMVESGKVTRVETTDRLFRTPSDIGVGSTLAELRKAYGSRLTSEENPYSGKDYFVVSASGNGIKFHVEEGKVTDLTSGTQSIRYVEGCL